MNIFERKIAKYFELIPNLNEKELEDSYPIYYQQNENGRVIIKTGIIFDKSLIIFKDTIKILDDISNSTEETSNLLKLYSIVYVKMYLFYLTNFLINNYQEMNTSFKEVFESIDNLRNKAISKVLKIYILKLIFNLKNCNYHEYQNFEFEKRGIYFFKEFKEMGKNKDINLTYNILPSKIEDFIKYKEFLEEVEKYQFSIDKKNIEVLIDNHGLDLFLIIIINKVISYLVSSDFHKNDIYLNFCNSSKKILIKRNYSKELRELLFLFFDNKDYNNIFKLKLSTKKVI